MVKKIEKSDLLLIPYMLVTLLVGCSFLHSDKVYEMVVMEKWEIMFTAVSNGYFFILAFLWLLNSRDDKEARKEIFEAIKTFFIALVAIIGLPNALSHLNQNFFIINTSFVFAAFLPMILGAYVNIIYFSRK